LVAYQVPEIFFLVTPKPDAALQWNMQPMYSKKRHQGIDSRFVFLKIQFILTEDSPSGDFSLVIAGARSLIARSGRCMCTYLNF
jgi:hypothetical protein